jgi:organic hydroperoxide reductase OsmC/OhrA
MFKHQAHLLWEKGDKEYRFETYNRKHLWTFKNGQSVFASAAPKFHGDPELLDPEDALVASAASCHLLSFLALAVKKGFVVERYEDRAYGILGENEHGQLMIKDIFLNPKVAFHQEKGCNEKTFFDLHEKAHEVCFIANSLRSTIHLSPEVIQLI